MTPRRAGAARALRLRLAYQPPLPWDALLAFFAARAIPGVEEVARGRYRRSFELDGVQGVASVWPARGAHALVARVDLEAPLAPGRVRERLRRLFDLDADAIAIAASLGCDRRLARALAAVGGVRVPGAFDGFELAVRAVLGQQVSVAAARRLAGRLAEAYGAPLRVDPGRASTLARIFPGPRALRRVDGRRIGLFRTRAAALAALARAVGRGELALGAPADPERCARELAGLPGIGAWTAQLVAMRALGAPDAFPCGDLGLRRALGAPGPPASAAALAAAAERWRPHRAYAAALLWLAPPEAAPRAAGVARAGPSPAVPGVAGAGRRPAGPAAAPAAARAPQPERGVRILHVAPYYPPDRMGGVGEVARALHEALLARGHDSEVATRGLGAAPGVHRIARTRLGWFLATLALAGRAARADVVHCHSGEALPLLLALRLWPRRRARVLLTLHVAGAAMARSERGFALEGRRLAGAGPARRALLALHRAVDAAALRLADALVTVSAATARDLLGPEGAARARVIHNGVAPPAGPEAPTAAPVALLYAGVAGPRKRVAALAFALRRVRGRAPGARLRLAGFELDREPALAALFREAGVADAVECVGRLGPAALAAQYRAASVLVLPSAYEGFPLVLLEAMQQGTPVVATHVGGNAEAVLDGVTGFLVPADDPEALAARCLALLEDPALARRMGEAARARVRERFGLEAQVERTLACYAELCARR